LGTSAIPLLGGCTFNLSSQYLSVVVDNETAERKSFSVYILDDNGDLSYGVENASVRSSTEGGLDRVILGEVPISNVNEVVVAVGGDRMPPYQVENDDCPHILLTVNIEAPEEVSFNQSCGDQLSS
jgi:hypothetical protein